RFTECRDPLCHPLDGDRSAKRCIAIAPSSDSAKRSSAAPGWCASSRTGRRVSGWPPPPGTHWACAEQSDEWVTDKRSLDIGELRQWQRDRAPKEVALTAG